MTRIFLVNAAPDFAPNTRFAAINDCRRKLTSACTSAGGADDACPIADESRGDESRKDESCL
jgi:hypothetical protein